MLIVVVAFTLTDLHAAVNNGLLLLHTSLRGLSGQRLAADRPLTQVTRMTW